MKNQRKNAVWIAAACGAVAGAAVATSKIHIPAIPFFATDRALHDYKPFLLAAVMGWAVFGVYWEKAAGGAAPAKSAESRGSRSLHVWLVNVALLLEILPICGFGRMLPLSSWVMATGLAIEAAGLWMAVWARRHLGRNWSGEISVKVDHQLIRSGPYRWLRHPIYTGLLLMYLGVAVVTGEWLAAAGFATAVVAYWRKLRIEEATLDAAFGPDYGEYRRTTWALVPGLF
jgi:protein-S-isoprenylcysteine O-methyltransferase Ste14